MRINFNAGRQKPQGVFARVLTAIVGVVVLIGAAMFSLVFLAVIAVAGLIFWVYFWWKTRALRRTLQEQGRTGGFEASTDGTAPFRSGASGTPEIIEGEAVRVDEDHEPPQR